MRGRIAGMRLITNVIQDFPDYIKDCKASGDDIVEFGLWFEEFIHPVDLVATVIYNAEHHVRQLTKDILYTRSFLKQSEYFKFGQQIGAIAGLLLEPVPQSFL